MKLDLKALGLAGGIFWAAGVLIVTIISMFTGYAGAWLGVLASIYPGFEVSFAGMIIGTAYGFADGFVGLFVLGWLYNRFAS